MYCYVVTNKRESMEKNVKNLSVYTCLLETQEYRANRSDTLWPQCMGALLWAISLAPVCAPGTMILAPKEPHNKD